MMPAITEQQVRLLHHTLGLQPERRESYRNRFLAGPGHHDMPDLEALERAGLMARRSAPSFCEEGDILFYATDAGECHAMDMLPDPPKRTRYEQYLRSDCGNTFAEWLGIDAPTAHHGRLGWMYERRRYNAYGGVEIVSGGWEPTKKAAKASYKEELRRFRGIAS